MTSTTAGAGVPVSTPTPDLDAENPLGEFDEGVRLVGTRCTTCGRTMLGARIVCSSCVSGDVQRVALPASGVLYSYTTLRVGPDAPRILGYVDLDDVRTLASIREDGVAVSPDARVELRHDDADWWFTPVSA